MSIVSLGSYEVLPVYNHFWLSRSVQEFWGRRYNLMISRFLHFTTFTPLQELVGNRRAALLTFTASGVMHVYAAWRAFDSSWPMLLRTLMMFILHGLAFVCGPRDSRVFTVLFLALTAPLFTLDFLELMPGFLLNSPAEEPMWAVELVAWWAPW